MGKTIRTQIYKCNLCGNIVDVMHVGATNLVCCGQPMELQAENTKEAATEKHIPVIEKINGGYKVKVGSVEHPMTEAHYIEWIELMADNQVLTQYLTPTDKPEAIFLSSATSVTARAYCNLHGNWKNN